MKHILSNVEYEDKLDGEKLTPDPEIVFTGIDEIKHMEKTCSNPSNSGGK